MNVTWEETSTDYAFGRLGKVSIEIMEGDYGFEWTIRHPSASNPNVTSVAIADESDTMDKAMEAAAYWVPKIKQ